MHPQPARHAFEMKPAVLEPDPRELASAEASEAPLAAKARIAWLGSRLRAPEEAALGLVDLLESPALQAKRDRGRLRIATPPLRECPALIDVGSRNARLPVGIDALFQRCVVELALSFQDRFEGAMLTPAGHQSVAKGEDHPSTLGCPKLTR